MNQGYLQKWLLGRAIYGITTGFGGVLANTYISPEQSEILQQNIIRSHATGVGALFEEDVVRAIILLRANALAKWYSGVRIGLINALLELLNHLDLALSGEGECIVDGKRVDSSDILKKNKIKPIKLKAKEYLALINGTQTQVMGALGCPAVHDSRNIIKNAQITGAMCLEALKGTDKAFDKKIHMVRSYSGQVDCAENMRNLLKNSEIIKSHKNCPKVQDAYMLRCIPQVYGVVIDTIDHVEKVIQTEINSAADNPLIFAKENEAISGGNFHGEQLAFVMDSLGIVLA